MNTKFEVDLAMQQEKCVALCRKHTMYTWSAGDAVNPLPIERAQGIYLYTMDGRRLMDFNSQLMSVNIGHGHPHVVEAIARQARELAYIAPGTATRVRARVGERLAGIFPGDLDTFFFTNGGAEANENAIRAARMYTGRSKILSRSRSYHGATNATLMLSGDPRRIPNEPGMPGVVRTMHPQPHRFSFGSSEEEITANNLAYLEEVIQEEGPQTIAAMFIETVTGTNGVLAPPRGYLPGLRRLLDKYGILLVCDEVMCGFGRTGKMFAFEHYDVLPDIVTVAKGLTSSYVPLGAMAIRTPLAEYFRKEVFWGGLTYNSHPLGLAAAEAVIDVLENEALVENAANMEAVMREEMDTLRARHPCVKEGRCIGLFGMVDLQSDSQGTPLAPYNGSHPAVKAFGKRLLETGLFTFTRWGSFMCNPPLTITREQIRAGFAIIDDALMLVDEAIA